MVNIIGRGLYGLISRICIDDEKYIVVPGRLRIRTRKNNICITGDDLEHPDTVATYGIPMSGEFKDNGLLITYEGDVEFGLEQQMIVGG